MHEIEIKLALPSADEARRLLAAAGVTPDGPRTFEDNRLYDDAAGTLSARQQILRLRTYGDRHTLTTKLLPGGTTDATYKTRVEHETRIEDPSALDLVLRALGYRVVYRYQKFRQSFRSSGLHVELDETPIGTFIELEGEPGAIDAVAARLGRVRADYIAKDYRTLQRELTGRDNPGDLVFADGDGSGS